MDCFVLAFDIVGAISLLLLYCFDYNYWDKPRKGESILAIVKIISHTPEPEKLVAAAGKLCYSPSSINELFESLDDDKVAYFVKLLAENGHGSTMEHVSFTFAIEGVSRSFLAQITRHRIASYSVQSQRYVPLRNFKSVLPIEVESDADATAAYDEAMDSVTEAYNKIADILTETHTKRLIAEGKSEKDAKRVARKLAIEDARAVLPNSCETKMLVTMNARSLMNFFAHRCCMRAQTEIRMVADQMLEQVKEIAPLLFAKAGPSCLRGKCPEGAMTCGKMADMKRKYGVE